MRLILVGGFLGAGKTTLLSEAAKQLASRGSTVGLITNDQVPDLVDTAVLARTGAAVREVAGSCFCCNFKGFHEAVCALAENGVDCIVAEPVGSCTDLSATIMQPLKDKFPEYALAPLSVLVDPIRVREVLRNRDSALHPDAAYILHLQLEEADQIVLTKCDSISDAERGEVVSFLRQEFPGILIHEISTHSGEGVKPWLDSVLAAAPAGLRVVEVDYDRYANGEAVLGWLNAVVTMRWIGGLSANWRGFTTDLFGALQAKLREEEREIGHIKALVECSTGVLTSNLTALDDGPQVYEEGALERLNATLTLNARVQIAPDEIDALFRDALKQASYGRVAATITAFHCIRPGRPVPTYRYDSIVA
ncbi:MAG: cobalamin synthesis protein P47K [Candidatus Hydrogenedentes bacterium]|nr:cobalamin synthesis protein P47K [Candidatus Hydrogenedentota bacterium]